MKNLIGVVAISTVLLLGASHSASSEDPCYSCQVAGVEGECTAVFPDAGFGFKNCSVVAVPQEVTVCFDEPVRICHTFTYDTYECRASNRCILAPPF